MLIEYLKLIRPKEWVKNLFVLIPAFFAAQIQTIWTSPNLIAAFCCFCLMASSVYMINDVNDLASDRLHPHKKNRPLAAGKIAPIYAIILALVFASVSLIGCYLISINAFLLIAIYFVINIAYSFGLKNYAIIDILIIAAGFLLRIFIGGSVIDVVVSKWLVLMVFLLSLILAFGKRRDDFLLMQEDADKKMRTSIHGYNLPFIDAAVLLLSIISIVVYILYTVSDDISNRLHTNYFYLTSFPVIVGFLRYLQQIHVFNNTGSPTSLLLKDRVIQITLLLWVLSIYFFIYA